MKKKVKKVEEHLKEAELHDKKKNNIVIHRLAESGSDKDDQKRLDDKKEIVTVVKDILKVNLENSDIKKIYRIGKISDKERPLLVEFKDAQTKNIVMESLSKLRNAEDRYRKISVSHDMTENEREQSKMLVKEAKEKQCNDQSGEWLYRVNGMPGDMRVVKLRKQL